MKQILLLGVFWLMCFFTTSAQTASAPTTGDGSDSSPYEITSLENLYWLSQNSAYWNKHFIQTADIDASGTATWNSGEGFSPIGVDLSSAFTGYYNGQGHIIRSLTVAGSANANSQNGLFGVISDATVENLGLLDVSISGGMINGGMIGIVYRGSTVRNCYIKGGSVSGTYAGGLSGINSGIISDCYVSVGLSGTTLGGVVASNNSDYGQINDCYYNSGTTGLSSTDMGTPLSVAQMQTPSNFEGFDFAGLNTDGTEDIWAIVTGLQDGYPVFLSQLNLSDPELGTTTISVSGTTATLTGSFSSLGVANPVAYGFCYSSINENPDINNSILSITNEITGTMDVEAANSLFTRTLNIDKSYYIRAFATNASGTVYSNSVIALTPPEGDGSVDSPFKISSLVDLRWLSQSSDYWDQGYYFKQTADIDASSISNFSPIGTTTAFTGTYDGQSHVITNLTNTSGDASIGLFSTISGSTISNLGLTDVNLSGGEGVAALVNYAYNSTISQCYSTGGINASASTAGGLVGYTNSSTSISNCYSSCTVSGQNKVGGLVGLNKGAATIKYCYSFGAVTSTTTSASAGDFLGENRVTNGVISCYYNTDTASQGTLNKLIGTNSGSVDANSTGLSSSEMQSLSSFTGWDFAGLTTDGEEEIWTINTFANSGYPILMKQAGNTSAPELGETTVTIQEDETTVLMESSFTTLGTPNPVAFGFCYSTSQANPIISTGTLVKIDAVNGYQTKANVDFTSQITIESGNNYYIRAYSTNPNSTVYSNVVTVISTSLSGKGTNDDPYLITSLDDLQTLSENTILWGSYFQQTADINATGTEGWNDGLGFSPIGDDPNYGSRQQVAFSGHYDGNGYSISNLSVLRPDERYIGLFGYNTTSSVLTDIMLINSSIDGYEYVGGVLGQNSGTINDCYYSGTIQGDRYTGGLTGHNSGNIAHSHTSGDINATNYTGGLVGFHYRGYIRYCYSNMAVSGDEHIGGLVGSIVSSSSEVTNCYATGSVTGEQYIGGFTGGNAGPINTCYSTGYVSGTSNTGAFVGYNSYTIRNSFYNSESTLQTVGIGDNNVIASAISLNALTTTAMKQGGSFKAYDWNFDSNWEISEGISFPRLQNVADAPVILQNFQNQFGVNTTTEVSIEIIPMDETDVSVDFIQKPDAAVISNTSILTWAPVETGVFTLELDAVDAAAYHQWYKTTLQVNLQGSGKEDDPFLITSLSDLKYLSETPSYWDANPNDYDNVDEGYHFKQTANIDATDTKNWNSDDGTALGFIPIGNIDTFFTGHYHGNGFVIKNLYINRPQDNITGLFGYMDMGSVDHLGVVNCTVTGAYYSGGLIGELGENSTVNNCYTTGTINISKPSSNAGGLVGWNEGSIENCYSTASVYGSTYLGGLVGRNSSIINHSYSTAEVQPTTASGGLIGVNTAYGTFNACYFNTEESGLSTGIGTNNNSDTESPSSLTIEEMRIASQFSNWDFTDTWEIEEGYTYPHIQNLEEAPVLTEVDDDLSIAGGQSITLSPDNGNVIDFDANDEISLIVQTGEHYSVNGNTITPEKDYYGELTVPVYVTDGFLNSEVLNVKITVKSATVITWETPINITYGTALSETLLNATANVAGHFTYSQEAGTVLDTGTQTLQVTFTPTDEDNYTSTTESVSITVNKATLSITTTDANRTYGEANPEFSYVSDGLVNGESIASVDLTTIATATSTTGTYAITPSNATLANDADLSNYNVTYNAGELTVNKATLTVTADNKSMKQGEDFPDFTVTYSGFVNSDDEGDIVTPPTATTNATSTSSVGTYDIIVTGGSDTNYNFSYVPGTLTITVPTGITDVTEDSLKVYPNPASDIIFIDGAEGMVILYNISGKKVLTHDLSNGNSIDISNLDKGIYILNVNGNNVKIIISR